MNLPIKPKCPMGNKLSLSVLNNITSIKPEAWNRLARRKEYSPFLEHEFLASLEAAGCAVPDNGWHPAHFLLRNGDTIIAGAPAWRRTHSMGEFIFDQGLAQAVMDMKKDYYPKLTATLPFTPSPGYRFLMDPEYDEVEVTRILLEGMRTYRRRTGLPTFSLLHVDPRWEPVLHAAQGETSPGLPLRWAHHYFIWRNQGYASFHDYLAQFPKNRRRNIRRERASIADAGLRIDIHTGPDLSDSLMDRMYQFYLTTNAAFGPWAAFFLNREWFLHIGKRWANRILLFAAYPPNSNNPVAMSLLVWKKQFLAGRYWGAQGFIKNLHFELCYYAPIEFAIRENIKFFDPGMGSPHKTRRGFQAREFGSYHEFAHPQVSTLFQAVLPRINRSERDYINYLQEGR